MPDEYNAIIQHFLENSGLDLQHYNLPQVRRRINMLSARFGFRSLADYYQALQSNPALLEASLDRLTINYTGFFRDQEFWRQLPDLAKMLNVQPLRIWSCGCATGEEAYSLAFTLSEFLPGAMYTIIASDIDKRALALARKGFYPEKSVSSLGQTERNRYFNEAMGGWQVRPEYKQRVTFYTHDILKDAYPLGNHIILCRNVIIYFAEKTKSLIYSKLSLALNPGGLLLLGASENIDNPHRHKLCAEKMATYRRIES